MKIINSLTEYNYWANELLLSLIEKEITEEMLDHEIISSFPSLRNTIMHIWDAEFIWLKRLNGIVSMSWPGNTFSGNFIQMKKELLLNSQAFRDFVRNMDETTFNSTFTYKNSEGKEFSNPIWQSVHHCMNHSTYHRGQVVTMMRQLGLTKIPATDFIVYCRIK
jgi:uncharacterized damage-inducible protein DinB